MFSCDRCGAVLKSKWGLKCHLKKTQPCPPIKSRDSPADILSRVFQKKDPLRCDMCLKTFSSYASKSVHKNQHCHAKTDTEESLKSIIERMMVGEKEKETTHVSVTINMNGNTTTNYNKNTISTTNTQNHTQNSNTVNINAYGREDVSHLTQPFLDQCVKRTNKGLVELIRSIHFDPSRPENANLRITNKKLPFIECNDGSKWVYDRKDRVLSDLVEKGTDIMQNHFEDHEERLSDKWSAAMYEHVKNWLEDVQDVRDNLRDKK